MPARSKPAPKDSTTAIGFEATAMRGSAFIQCEASPQVASTAKGNRANISIYWRFAA